MNNSPDFGKILKRNMSAEFLRSRFPIQNNFFDSCKSIPNKIIIILNYFVLAIFRPKIVKIEVFSKNLTEEDFSKKSTVHTYSTLYFHSFDPSYKCTP